MGVAGLVFCSVWVLLVMGVLLLCKSVFVSAVGCVSHSLWVLQALYFALVVCYWL